MYTASQCVCTSLSQYSVHPSAQSSVQVYIYVQSRMQAHCAEGIQGTAGAQLAHIWSTAGRQSCNLTHLVYNPQTHPQVVYTAAKSGYVQCSIPMEQSDGMFPHDQWSSVYPCTVHVCFSLSLPHL